MESIDSARPPVWLRIVAAVALLWNFGGVWSYMMHVGLVASPPDMPQAVMPALVTSAYAVGVFGSVVGCIGLLLARRWAFPVLLVSLICLIIDWGWVLTNTAEASMPLGIAILAIALLLVQLARHAAGKNWLK